MTLLSPDSLYYSGRYKVKSDRWSMVKDVTTLTDALLYKLSTIISPRIQYNALDIGCGNLWTSCIIAKAFPNIKFHGIDFAYDAIISSNPDLLNELSKQAITFEKADWFTYASDIKYDIIFDIGLFHHLVPEDWPNYIQQINKMLKAEGSLFMRSFHTSDGNWNEQVSGGHIRKDYYCHYHTLSSLQDIFNNISLGGIEVARCKHFEHVECLYQFTRSAFDVTSMEK
jgi:cyclopropane fatty-acyl-phospholipid synthase-like methyltransferase